MTTISGDALTRFLGIPNWSCLRLAELGVFERAHDGENIEAGAHKSPQALPEGWVLLPDGHIEMPVTDFAESFGLTVQRINQLADQGIVVKTRRGVCDGTKSAGRVIAYQIEVARHRADRGEKAPASRSATYWTGRARELSLKDGITFTEFRLITERVEALTDSILAIREAMQALLLSMPDIQIPREPADRFKASLHASDAALEQTINSISAAAERAEEHSDWQIDEK